jgi:anthranilate synthase component 2
MKVLLLDNYDSFTYNLVHYIEKVSDAAVDVFRNDEIKLKDIEKYDKIMLSPGAGLPCNAGIMPALLKTYYKTKSILGICLGQQAIGEAFGGSLVNLNEVFHGVTTPVEITNDDYIFKNLPKKFNVGRYHSWVVNKKDLPDELEVTAIDEFGNIMAMRHKTYNIRGVQFHPESILSEYGLDIISNWVNNK